MQQAATPKDKNVHAAFVKEVADQNVRQPPVGTNVFSVAYNGATGVSESLVRRKVDWQATVNICFYPLHFQPEGGGEYSTRLENIDHFFYGLNL